MEITKSTQNASIAIKLISAIDFLNFENLISDEQSVLRTYLNEFKYGIYQKELIEPDFDIHYQEFNSDNGEIKIELSCFDDLRGNYNPDKPCRKSTDLIFDFITIRLDLNNRVLYSEYDWQHYMPNGIKNPFNDGLGNNI